MKKLKQNCHFCQAGNTECCGNLSIRREQRKTRKKTARPH